MKKYEEPLMEIKCCSEEDIIRTSPFGEGTGDDGWV